MILHEHHRRIQPHARKKRKKKTPHTNSLIRERLTTRAHAPPAGARRSPQRNGNAAKAKLGDSSSSSNSLQALTRTVPASTPFAHVSLTSPGHGARRHCKPRDHSNTPQHYYRGVVARGCKQGMSLPASCCSNGQAECVQHYSLISQSSSSSSSRRSGASS